MIFTFRVTRSIGDHSEPLRVFLRYEGTATPDTDYSALPEAVDIPAGKAGSPPSPRRPSTTGSPKATKPLSLSSATPLPISRNTRTARRRIRPPPAFSRTQ
ncbi:MAG: hypothetical protein QM760_17930 [Nibricoccus sp.]